MRASCLFAAGVALFAGVAASPVSARATVQPAEALASPRALARTFAAVAGVIAPSIVRLEVGGVSASGVILDTRGNVVTEGRLFERSEKKKADGSAGISMTLADGRALAGELVGLDRASDVAVVRIAAPVPELSAARFGDSDGAALGDWVVVVGRLPGGAPLVTGGIISGRGARGRDPPRARRGDLLTDARVEPADVGGALVDLEGEVVGLNAGAAGGIASGRALPINDVRRVAVALMRDGRAAHPYIGVGVRDPQDVAGAGARSGWGGITAHGALVSHVWRGAPAARAGLRAGDLIVSIDSTDVPNPDELVSLIAAKEIGARVIVGFVRNGADRAVPISIDDLQGRAPLATSAR